MNTMRLFVLPVLAVLGSASLSAADDSLYLYVTYGQTLTAIKSFITAEDMRGASIAAEQINEAGGLLGKKIVLIDGVATSLDSAKAQALEQIAGNRITAVVGANTSNFSMLVGPLFQEAGIPMVSPIATLPAVTAIGNYVFRMCFTDPLQGTLMARFAREDLGAKTAVILKKADDIFSNSVSEYFEREFSRTGTLLWTGTYLGDDSDFTAQLTRIKELNPDAVFVPGHGQDSGRILKQSHAMGIKTVFLGADGWGKGALGIAGPEAAEGNYFANHWHLGAASAGSEEFIRRYRAKYGEDQIAASAALAYDAVFLIADAIRRAGSLDRSRIRDAIADTRAFTGITGSISFDEQGDPVGKQGVILKYRDGGIAFEKTLRLR